MKQGFEDFKSDTNWKNLLMNYKKTEGRVDLWYQDQQNFNKTNA